MYCENCGKKLIRGYQFCMECGTPVPPEAEEEENEEAQANEQPAGEQPSGEMPGIQPLGNEEGTLVFCPTCGMRMQKSTDYCEKCGMKLNANGSSGVPLVNTDPLGGEFGGISDNDIARIDSFVNNSGLGGDISYDTTGSDSFGGLDGGIGGLGGGDLNSEIEALNQQFANLNATSSDMPAISAPVPEPEPEPEPVPQEPDLGSLSRRVDDFSMEAGMPETQFLSESGLPVINGGEMTEPDEPMQLEQNYDDINIDITAPAPTYTAPETTSYTEPEAPAYSAPETASYTEPEAPAYSASETASYSEPEAPAYSAPETTSYTEPEAPAYSAPETTSYAEPEAPAYSAPETTSYAEPEAPAYSAPETTSYTEPEAPAYSAPETTSYTEPEAPAYSAPETASYAEPEAPAYSAPETASYTQPDFTQPRRPEPEPSAEIPENGEADLGKLIYCRNCGQDMYEKEAVCKNCGSPNKWNIKPLKKSVSGSASKSEKKPAKLFGVLPIPTVIGAAVVVVGVIALIVATSTANRSEDIVGTPSTPTTTPTTSGAPVEADESAVADVTDVSDVPDVPSEPEEIKPVVTTESQPESSVTEESSVPATVESSAETDSRPAATTSGTSVSSSASSVTTRPNAVTTRPNAVTTRPNAVTTRPNAVVSSSNAVTTRPNASSSRPAATTAPRTTVTTKNNAVSAKPSATVTNEDKQREKILDAFEAISAEVGKLHVYSQATSYAIDEGFTKTKFTSGMTSILSSGKSSVSTQVKNAKPSSSELSGAYASLQKLYDLYTDYYTYVTDTSDTGSKYTSTADSKLSSFNSAAKGLSFKSLQTVNQTSSDKSRQYSDMLSNASAAASNAASQFNTVKNAVTNLKSNKYESDVMGVIYTDKASAMLKAAGYAQVVSNYDEMMSGAPSEYSSAKSSLTTAASDLDGMLGVFIDAAYNTLSGFKTEFNSYNNSVDKAVSAINKAV